MAKDPYRIIQVAHHAEPEVIEAAYKRLARKYHPDLSSSADATAHMQDLNWAYQILIDPAKRARYDRGIGRKVTPKPKPPKSRPPPPKPAPATPKPKPPPPKAKAYTSAKKASAGTQSSRQKAPRPKPKLNKMGPTERRILRAVGAIGITLFAIAFIARDPAPVVRATAQPPASPAPTGVFKLTPVPTLGLPSGTLTLLGEPIYMDEQEFGVDLWAETRQGVNMRALNITSTRIQYTATHLASDSTGHDTIRQFYCGAAVLHGSECSVGIDLFEQTLLSGQSNIGDLEMRSWHHTDISAASHRETSPTAGSG